MTTVKDIKTGSEIAEPVYISKPFVVLGKDNVILHAGTLESIKALSDYYDKCAVEIRKYDLYLNNNAKVETPERAKFNKLTRVQQQAVMIVRMRALLSNANNRLDCLVKYYEEETDLEDTITLDDGALASAWREQYFELLKELDEYQMR